MQLHACADLLLVLLILAPGCAAKSEGPDSVVGGGGAAATGGSIASGGGGSGGTHEATGGTWSSGGSTSGGGGGASGSGGSGGTKPDGGVSGSGGAEGGTCKQSCTGVECGPVPDGCNSTFDCGDCGPDATYCVASPPKHKNAVYDGMVAVEAAHPEYFDLADCLGCCSCKVLDLAGFISALVAEVSASGLIAIPDPNSTEEIRVRAASDNSAENYDCYTSTGYSNSKYTSTCVPAGF